MTFASAKEHEEGVAVGRESGEDSGAVRNRSARYLSHAIVEVRRFRWIPLFCHSAVLLDVSKSGFKLEFMGDLKVAPGQQYWLQIPLAPLGISGSKKLSCLAEIRWFDDQRQRVGGVFLNPSTADLSLIEQVVTRLKARGQI